MRQLDVYIQKQKEHLVMEVKKAFYGLKQVPRAWYINLDKCLRQFEVLKSMHSRMVPIGYHINWITCQALSFPCIIFFRLKNEQI